MSVVSVKVSLLIICLSVICIYWHRCYLFSKSFCRVFIQPLVKVFTFEATHYFNQVILSRCHYRGRTFVRWFSSDVGSQWKKSLPSQAGKVIMWTILGEMVKWTMDATPSSLDIMSLRLELYCRGGPFRFPLEWWDFFILSFWLIEELFQLMGY